MSRLQDFLALPDVSTMTEEIYINARLGTFTVTPMTERQASGYRRRCRGTRGRGNFDSEKFNLLVAAGQTVEPDFASTEFLGQSGCSTAEEFISRKFKTGEIADIAEKIAGISGFDVSISEEIEEAKNS